MREFDVFARTHGGRKEEEFLREFDCPFILILVDVGVSADTKGFQTDTLTDPFEPGSNTPMPFVTPLKPRIGNRRAFDMVTIGRTDANDIVVPLAEISKLHCYFTRSLDGTYSIVDSGSTNGTKVNGNLIPSKKPHPLLGGEEIVLADRVSAIYLLPRELFQRLQAFA